MSINLEVSDLRKKLAAKDGLLSRIASALHLDTHPEGVIKGLEEYCKNSEHARRNANKATQPIQQVNP